MWRRISCEIDRKRRCNVDAVSFSILCLSAAASVRSLALKMGASHAPLHPQHHSNSFQFIRRNTHHGVADGGGWWCMDRRAWRALTVPVLHYQVRVVVYVPTYRTECENRFLSSRDSHLLTTVSNVLTTVSNVLTTVSNYWLLTNLLTKFEDVARADNKLQTLAGVRDSVTIVS